MMQFFSQNCLNQISSPPAKQLAQSQQSNNYVIVVAVLNYSHKLTAVIIVQMIIQELPTMNETYLLIPLNYSQLKQHCCLSASLRAIQFNSNRLILFHFGHSAAIVHWGEREREFLLNLLEARVTVTPNHKLEHSCQCQQFGSFAYKSIVCAAVNK